MRLGWSRTLAAMLTIQAGLTAYGTARAARAYMQAPANDVRSVPLATPTAARAPAKDVASVESGFSEIIDPWQPKLRTAHRPGEELVNPWPERSALGDEPELIDPWRSERSRDSNAITVAAFDWNAIEPELLDPWPSTVSGPDYELPELIDPWSVVR